LAHEYHIGSTRKLDALLIHEAKVKGITIDDKDLIQIEFPDSPDIAKQLSENKDPIVFTSRHAVTALEKLVNQYRIRLQSNQAFAIEGKTSQAASKAGFDLLATAPDSGVLAQKIISLQKVKRLLHLSANIRLDGWKKLLTENGIEINTLEVYHKEINTGLFRTDNGVLFFSPSQVDAFWKENNLTKDAPAFCVGETTANRVAELQHSNIQVAEQSSEKEILNTVYRYYNLI